MKKINTILSTFIIIFCASLIIACSDGESPAQLRENNFDALIMFCKATSTKQTDVSNNQSYYDLAWSDSDSQTEIVYFSMRIYENKTILFAGIPVLEQNNSFRLEATYIIKFIYGSENNNRLVFEVYFHYIIRALQSKYNYYPYVMDEYESSDKNAVFDTSTWTASCYSEVHTSKNGSFSLNNPSTILRVKSNDSFNQIKTFLTNKVNIPLFIENNKES